jgi:hypothetical protein
LCPATTNGLLHDHEVIAEAVLSGDGDRAENLMREHMEEYVEIFEDRFTGFMDETSTGSEVGDSLMATVVGSCGRQIPTS